MRHFGLALGAVIALAGCQPTIPDSAAGVGFGDYESYEAERVARDAALVTSQREIAPETPSAPIISGEEFAAAGLPSGASGPTTTLPQTLPTTTAVASTTPIAATPPSSNPSISDEQDFQAVSSRETIESDRERLEQNAASYTVIQPTAVPDRPGGGTPNIVSYALSTQNSVGQPVYRRSVGNVQRALWRCRSSGADRPFSNAGGPAQRPPRA